VLNAASCLNNKACPPSHPLNPQTFECGEHIDEFLFTPKSFLIEHSRMSNATYLGSDLRDVTCNMVTVCFEYRK
jgi:hypothetical protein